MSGRTIRLRLPATSANLGPGFDALGLAMDFHLHVEAEVEPETALEVTGRDAAKIAHAADNLLLATFREVLQHAGRTVPGIALRLHNEIPLGMGCGSSAAALVAGVALANQVGQLGWSAMQVMAEASRREGHPDNVAACVLGGFVASAMRGTEVEAVSLVPHAAWKLLVVLPSAGLSTKVARGLLPESYSRVDAVTNVQNTALLTAAFATGRADLLRQAMADRMHQPYRAAVCPLLEPVLALAAEGNENDTGVLGAALSGAGPSVLLIVSESADPARVEHAVRSCLGVQARPVDMMWTRIAGAAQLG